MSTSLSAPQARLGNTEHMGSDGASELGDVERSREFAARESIRRACRERLHQCASNSKSAMSSEDVETFMRQGLEEEALADAKDEKEKTMWAEQQRERFVPMFIEQTQRAGQRVEALLRSARAEKAISTENFDEWMDRMKNGSWTQTREFIDNKLPTYVRNWKKVAERRRTLLKDPRMKTLQKSKVLKPDELKKFMSGKDFLNADYQERVHLVDIVKAAFAGVEKGPPLEKLKVEAREKLQEAVDLKILAPHKVGTWMKRIFTKDHSPETIQNFLNNKGSFPLSTLMEHWAKVRTRFDNLKDLRKEKGTPQSFHFVTDTVFLDWDYDRKKAYVQEAENRFKDIAKEDILLLKIRHEMDAKDWESAEELLDKADGLEWSVEDAKKIQDLKDFFETHSTFEEASEENEKKKETPSPESVLAEVRQALNEIPVESIKMRFIEAMQNYDYQTLWALCTMYYNWKWCRIHGYSSDEKDEQYRSTAKEETHLALKGIETEGYTENRDATNDTAIRQSVIHDPDSKRPKVENVDASTDPKGLIAGIDLQKNNRNFWYYTRMVDKNVPFSVVDHMITNTMPKLKRGMRKLEKMNVRFTTSGAPEFKNKTIVDKAMESTRSRAHETNYAIAM